ncbi:fibrocystin isoform X2 [Ambystoma mexicanum]|uniref:fibrocystin isoform X2 n=1 Tax=Ambystoma mexicanum TaxID=8296 RepID=UPI0037E78B82
MMASVLLLALFIMETPLLKVSPWRIHIEPTEGSVAGGTFITIRFDGLDHLEVRSAFSACQIEVSLVNPPMPRIPCDLYPVYSDVSVVKCKTRPSKNEGTYWLKVTFSGPAVNHCGVLYDNNCTFKYSAANTPKIYQVEPPCGVPGNIIAISGWVLTDKYETFDFNIDYIDGPPQLESGEDGWISICSLADKQTNAIYPIQVDHGFGSLQCRVEGHIIGSHNISFSVFNIGKSAVNKDAWLISAKQELFLFQTHSDVWSIFPVNGSLGGGTEITIKGDFFLQPAKVTIAGAPCKILQISPTKIVCTTGPVGHPSLKAPQPGNRGLLFQVWNGTTENNFTKSSTGYRWGFAPNASSLLHFLSGVPGPFSSSLSGFFVAPETNNYTFWIRADSNACLYFCQSEEARNKVKIASIPTGISTWSDNWEQNWDTTWQQKSQKFELVGGKKYYLEAWHHGRMPSRGMTVGIQIHNTWLNPEVVNTYHREKIEIEVRALRLPEIQVLSLTGVGWTRLSWDNVSSCLIPTNATAHQIEKAIEGLISVKCVTEPSSAAILLRADFEQGLDAAATKGELTVWGAPFCGRFSSRNPKHLIRMPPSSTTGYDFSKYTHVCFAYRGHISNDVNVSISYIDILLKLVEANLTCVWNRNETDPESWRFACSDLWRSCMRSSAFPKEAQVNSKIALHQIDLLPLKMEDDVYNWFYVDEVIVSDGNLTVFPMDPRPAHPGGGLIERVSVVGSSPTFTLSFWVANCVLHLPLIALSGVLPASGSSHVGSLSEYMEYENDSVKLTVQRLQALSPPVEGTFKIQLSDTVLPGVPVNISSTNLHKLLQSNSDTFTAQYINVSDFTAFKSMSTCHHSTWTLTWASTIGDVPDLIKVFDENLTGVNPTVKSRIVYDGGVFIGPIFGDMLATAHELPQVAVHVNEIPASCSGSCTFQYLQDMTPLVTHIEYSSDDGNGMDVYITGYHFPIEIDSQAISIEVSETNCEIIQVNTTRVVCSMSTVPPRGMHRITVLVKPHGYAVNGSGEAIYLKVEPRIFTIKPSAVAETGGSWVTLKGMSLDGAEQVLFGVQPAYINFNTSNSTVIVCRAPAKAEEDDVVNVTVTVHGNQSTFLMNAFEYNPSLNPVVLSLSRNTSSTAGGQVLEIRMLRFEDYADQEVKVTVQSTLAEVKGQSSSGVQVVLPPLPIGLYNISIMISGVEIRPTESCKEDLVMQYLGEITNVEPCCGSFKGGTLLTITGKGFSSNSSLVSVLLHTDTCDIISASEEVIQCKSRPIRSSVRLNIINALIRVFIGDLHGCHLGYPTQTFYFAYDKSYTSVVSAIFWEIQGTKALFNLTGTNLTNSTLQVGGSSCDLETPRANDTPHYCSLLLDGLEAGMYPISVFQKQTGYADISSTLTVFDLTPLVYSISPLSGSVCGGATLTISGQFFKSSSNSVEVSLTSEEYSCAVQDFSNRTIRCRLHSNPSLTLMSNWSQAINITVITNGISSACQGNCTFHTLEEKTPIVQEVKHKVSGNKSTLHIRGERLDHSIGELDVWVDKNTLCNTAFRNQTTVVCEFNHVYPGRHSISVFIKGIGQACFSNGSMDFTVVPQVISIVPKNISINGGAPLTIEGFALQGQSTTVRIGNGSVCAITALSYVTIQCLAPPGNMSSALSIEIDGRVYYGGEINYSQDFTPVFLYPLNYTRRLLRIAALRITEVENVQIFVGDSICANVSGNSTVLQCLVPHLPAGDYRVKGYGIKRGWASSNATYSSRLTVTSVRNNLGCLGRGDLHLTGTGFSQRNTSVIVCGSHCEVQDSLTTPTDVWCAVQHLNDSLNFLCGFTQDTSDGCHRTQDTYIQCDVTVSVGSYSWTRRMAYVYACNGSLSASSQKTEGSTSFISGLFFSPKVERDEVLIYNSSCAVALATEAEMECEAPNQPITSKITEIRKNWGRDVKGNISLRFCGRWSERSSWPSGRPPQDGDNVTVERGQTLLLDASTAVLNRLHLKGGKVVFLEPGPVILHAHYVLVSEGGELKVGSEEEPYRGRAQIHLHGSGRSRPFFPYGVKFLAVRNGTLSIHGWQPEVPFTHLKSPAYANDSKLVLEKSVDWRPGDEVVISGVDLDDDLGQGEVLTIKAVRNAEILFRPPLRHHYGFVEQSVDGRPIVMKPRVALLTRDVVLRGTLTRERVSYVQQCAEAGISDLSKCIYGKSEATLGGRDMGAVVIIQTFPGEPSFVWLEGLQLQHVGQAFRKPLAAITIAGNGHMNGSYIRGCSLRDSFGRGLSLSSTSNMRVENNILHNVSGHGILLKDGLEHGNSIYRNVVLGISGTDALSNIETLSPAGVYIRAPANKIEENDVWGAGIGFFYHLSPDGPSQTLPQSFKKNTAGFCRRCGLRVYPEYCPKNTRQAATTVFQTFTAWRSRGGAQIYKSCNLQLRNFKILDCTDFGIDIRESLGNTSVVDSLLIGSFTGKGNDCMTDGIKTPKRFQILLYNTTFMNFNLQSCTAISTCSDCYKGQGGFRVKAEQLKFINSPNPTVFHFPNCAILEDIDGSISGKYGSHLLAHMDTLPVSCLEYSNISRASRVSVCGKDVVLHRASFGLNKAADKEYNISVTNRSNKTISVNYVQDTLSNPFGWMVLLVDTEAYTVAFDDPSVVKLLQYSATFDNFAAGNYLLIEHGSLPSRVDVTVTCGGRPGQSLQFPPSPSHNKDCDWFFNKEEQKITYLVTGEGEVRVTFKTEERIPTPPTGSTESPNVLLKWSQPESWQEVEPGWGGSNYTVPSAGDDVIILPNRTVFVDVTLPPLGGLYVLGTLQFPVNSSNVLSAGCILIAGGELIVGSRTHPLERDYKVHILLRTSEDISCHRLDGINVEPGTIGVFGKLQIYSAYPEKSWTRLRADISPGNERILLEDDVDWTPGDHLVISSSTYDAHQAELVTLKEVAHNNLKLQEQLVYRHAGGIHGVEEQTFSLAAEVGLLTRHVQIVSDTPCSGRLQVGQLKRSNGLYFTGILQLSNVEIRKFGTSQHASVEFGNIPSGSSVMFSSIHHSCRGGLQAVASSNISLHGNVVFNTNGHGISFEGQNHTLERNLVLLTKQHEAVEEWVSGIKINLADGISLFDNTVAGSERIGFHISGQKCGEYENPWVGNVVHSSLHGVHLYNGDGFQNCTKVLGFMVYKNSDYGVMCHVGSSVLMENVTLVDNTISLLPIVYDEYTGENNLQKKFIELRNALIVGTSSAFDCLKDRIRPSYAISTPKYRAPSNPLRGRVGIIWPIFSSGPDQWTRDSWHSVSNYSRVYGITKLQDVTFSGFVKSCHSDDNDVCIMSSPENAHVMYPIITERTTMSRIKDINGFFFHSSQPRFGESKCPEMSCDSRRKALFKDLDGSSLGLVHPVTVFSGSEFERMAACYNTGTYRKDTQCIYKFKSQLYFCKEIDHAMIILENMDAEISNISPVVSVTDTFVDVFINPGSSDCCVQNTTTFYSILPANKITKVCFNGQTPRHLRVYLIGGNNTTKMVLAIFYDVPQSLKVFVKGRLVPSSPLISHSQLMKSEHGVNFFTFKENLLYVLVQGEEPIDIRAFPSILIAFPITGKSTDEDNQMQLIIRLANFIHITVSQVRILHKIPENDPALKYILDNAEKRSLHCPHKVYSGRINNRYGMQESFQGKVHLWKDDAINNATPISEVVIVEISDSFLSDADSWKFMRTPLLSSDMLKGVASHLILAHQTGELATALHQQIDSLLMAESAPSGLGETFGRLDGENIGSAVYRRPYSLCVQKQPSDGHVERALAVQPKVIFLDKQGHRVEAIGYSEQPWSMTVQIKGSKQATLKGNTTVMVKNGWANFSSLAVSTSGSDWCLVFSVTSPPGVKFTAESRQFTIFPGPVRMFSSTIQAVVFGSITSAVFLCALLICILQKSKNKQTTSEHGVGLHRNRTWKPSTTKAKFHPHGQLPSSREEMHAGSAALEGGMDWRNDADVTPPRTCHGAHMPVPGGNPIILCGDSSDPHARSAEHPALAAKCDTACPLGRRPKESLPDLQRIPV